MTIQVSGVQQRTTRTGHCLTRTLMLAACWGRSLCTSAVLRTLSATMDMTLCASRTCVIVLARAMILSGECGALFVGFLFVMWTVSTADFDDPL